MNVRRFIAVVLTLLVGLGALGTGVAAADPGERSLFWVIASGRDGSDCASGPFHPNITATPNGESIQLWGCGTLTTKPKTADGGGTFERTVGSDVTTGTWSALRLLRWQSYDATVEFEGTTFEGGQATVAVRLTPDGSGPTVDGILQVFCLIGDAPDGTQEGIRLAIQGGPNFNRQLSGETGFVPQS